MATLAPAYSYGTVAIREIDETVAGGGQVWKYAIDIGRATLYLTQQDMDILRGFVLRATEKGNVDQPAPTA